MNKVIQNFGVIFSLLMFTNVSLSAQTNRISVKVPDFKRFVIVTQDLSLIHI